MELGDRTMQRGPEVASGQSDGFIQFKACAMSPADSVCDIQHIKINNDTLQLNTYRTQKVS
jgi:hypothetical protein